jgi:hypothetical protein
VAMVQRQAGDRSDLQNSRHVTNGWYSECKGAESVARKRRGKRTGGCGEGYDADGEWRHLGYGDEGEIVDAQAEG